MSTAVIYYSFTGNTQALAQEQANARQADLIQVREKGSRGKIGAYLSGSLAAMGHRAVEIAPIEVDLSAYDHIVLMAPVWAGQLAPAVNSVIALLPSGSQVEVIAVSASGKSKAQAHVQSQLEARGCRLTGFTDRQP